MVVITRKHLSSAAVKYRDAAAEIAAFYAIAAEARWRSFVDVRATFPDADAVDGYVICNIRRNRYRLVTVIHYARETEGRRTQGHLYVRSFLTHREYDDRRNWDREFGR